MKGISSDLPVGAGFSPPPAERTTEDLGHQSGPGAVHRILLVDDEPGIRQSLAAYLQDSGFQTDTAPDGSVALGMLAEHSYDLMLTDISMPHLDGIQLLKQSRELYPMTEVIMITAYMDISFAIQAMRSGAYDFFTKPLNYEKIVLTMERVAEKRRLELKARQYELLKRQQEVADQATLEATLGLARAAEERDRTNIGHGKRTALYACMIGKKLGISPEHTQRLRSAALLHDIGKIGIDDRILTKPERLDEAEFRSVRRHPEIGEYIITPITSLRSIAKVVRHHHERWDGSGYPDGLEGEAIPLDARILCIADYFDSITSARPYRSPMSTKAAIELIEEGAGRTFDPILAGLFVEALRGGQLDEDAWSED